MLCTQTCQNIAIETYSLGEMPRSAPGRKSSSKEIDCYDAIWASLGLSENICYVVANWQAYSTGERVRNIMRDRAELIVLHRTTLLAPYNPARWSESR